MSERDDVLRLLWQIGGELFVKYLSSLHGRAPPVREAGVVHDFRNRVPMTRRQLLPLHGHHAMALQISKRTVVRDNLERVRGMLKATSRLVPPIAALARDPCE